MDKLEYIINDLGKNFTNIKKNPNRSYTINFLLDKQLEIKELSKTFSNLYNDLKNELDDNEKLILEQENKSFKTLVKAFKELIEEKLLKFTNSNKKNNCKMALSSDKVLDMVTKLFPVEYGGDPLKLAQTVKILKAIKETVTHDDNRSQVISLISLKLVGKAADALPENVDSIDKIIDSLSKTCKGQSSRQLISTLEGTPCTDRRKYVCDLRDIAQKLQVAYVNEGVRKDTAMSYVIDDVTKNVKKNFIQNKVMVASMNQQFNSVDEIIHRFETVQIDRDTSILYYHQNKNHNNKNNHHNKNGKNEYQKKKKWNNNKYKNNQSGGQNKKQSVAVRPVNEEVTENSVTPHQGRMGD